MTPQLQDRDLRQRDLIPPEKLARCRALVIGIGAVGRQVALQLAAVGIAEMTLVDFDVVEAANLAPQGYAPEDLGKLKVEATAAWCRTLNPELNLLVDSQRFRRSSPKTLVWFAPSQQSAGEDRLVVFCCVDSITTRKVVWEATKDRAAFFTDGRMAAEVIRVLASDHPGIDERYPRTLFGADQAYTGACTAKSTIYAASIAAGFMLGQFTRWLRGMSVERDQLLNLLASELTVS